MKRVIITEFKAQFFINCGAFLKLVLGLLIGLVPWFVWTYLNYGNMFTSLPKYVQDLNYFWFAIAGVGVSFIYIPIHGGIELSFGSKQPTPGKRVFGELVYPDGRTEQVHVSRANH